MPKMKPPLTVELLDQLEQLENALEDQIESSKRWRRSSDRWYRNWKVTFGALSVAVITAVVGWLR